MSGEASLRRGILLQSLVESESGEKPGILENVLRRSVQLVGEGNLAGVMRRGDDSKANTAADRMDAEIERWSDIVEQHLTRRLDRTRTHVFLTSTPASMRALGLPDLQVRTGPHMMDYANVRLTRAQMDNLPRELANPKAVYIHEGNNGPSINFVTGIERNGEHLVIALKPNQHISESENAHFVATLVNVRTERLVGEFRKGHGMYVESKDAFDGLRDATDFAQKKNGRRASEVREHMSRTYGLASLTKRLLFKSDLVNLINEGRAQYSKATRTPFIAQNDEGYLPALNRVVELFKSGERAKVQEAGNTPIPISRTPVVLRQVMEANGSKPFRRSDYVVGQGSTLYLKAENIHSKSNHSGKVSLDVLRNLPQLIADPVAVFKSSLASEDPNSFKVLTDAVDENGNPVVVAIKPNVFIKSLGNAQAHWQATIFPATWEEIAALSAAGDLRYYNEKSHAARVVGSNPRESGTEAVHTRLGFDASLGAQASKVKVITKGEIENMPAASYSANDGIAQSMPLPRAEAESRIKSILGDKLGKVLIDSGLVTLVDTEQGLRNLPGARYMVAWHGSPHDHEKFDSSKIGTGEGAQGYGYGHYFASNKDVAEWYKNKLSKTEVRHKGNTAQDYGYETPMGVVLSAMRAAKTTDISSESFKAKLGNIFTTLLSPQEFRDEARKFARENKFEIEKGKLYQVELAPSEDEYLDLDKPLSEQSKLVRNALDAAGYSVSNRSSINDIFDSLGIDSSDIKQPNAAAFYWGLSSEKGSEKSASDYLHSIGIRGTRYLDGSSRSAGKGSSKDYLNKPSFPDVLSYRC